MNVRSVIAVKIAAAFAVTAISLAAAPQAAHAADATPVRESIAPAFAEALPNVPGKTITALVVDYPPAGKSIPHRHGQSFVIGYVLSGAIRSGINGGEAHVYHAGEHWTENPGVHHTVSENASSTEPAKLLAIFVADDSDRNLVTWDKH